MFDLNSPKPRPHQMLPPAIPSCRYAATSSSTPHPYSLTHSFDSLRYAAFCIVGHLVRNIS